MFSLPIPKLTRTFSPMKEKLFYNEGRFVRTSVRHRLDDKDIKVCMMITETCKIENEYHFFVIIILKFVYEF